MRGRSAIYHRSLQLLQRAYAHALPQRLDEVVGQWHELSGAWRPERAARLERRLQTLAASSTTYGFSGVAELLAGLSGQLQPVVREARAPSADERYRMQLLVERIGAHDLPEPELHSAEREVVLPPSPARSRPLDAHVFLAERDFGLASELGHQLEQFGYTPSHFRHLDEVAAATLEILPSAIIVESRLLDAESVAALRALHSVPIPLIVISDDGGLPARLLALRCGGDAFFSKPVDINRLVTRIDRLTAWLPEDDAPFQILIVDDQRSVARYHEALLQRAGMQCRIVIDPMEILEAIEAQTPDMILMDLYMPDCTGLELAAVIRQEERWSGIPIVFISTEQDPERQRRAINEGGDDFLTKPVPAARLVSVVTSRVRRARAMNNLMLRDGLTHLFNPATIKEQLAVEVVRAQRTGGTLSFARLDLDGLGAINERHGHAVGDQVIKRLARMLWDRFRRTDYVGRFVGGGFAIILTATDGPTARRLLDEIRQAFSALTHEVDAQPFPMTFSAGIASVESAPDLIQLEQQADAALFAAKRRGGNQVVLDGAPDG